MLAYHHLNIENIKAHHKNFHYSIFIYPWKLGTYFLIIKFNFWTPFTQESIILYILAQWSNCWRRIWKRDDTYIFFTSVISPLRFVLPPWVLSPLRAGILLSSMKECKILAYILSTYGIIEQKELFFATPAATWGLQQGA